MRGRVDLASTSPAHCAFLTFEQARYLSLSHHGISTHRQTLFVWLSSITPPRHLARLFHFQILTLETSFILSKRQ